MTSVEEMQPERPRNKSFILGHAFCVIEEIKQLLILGISISDTTI